MDASEGTYCDKSISPTRWGTMKQKNLHLLLRQQTYEPPVVPPYRHFHFNKKAPLKQKVEIEKAYKG